MLETIREYARLKLESEDDPEAIRDRHLAHYDQLGERAEMMLRGSAQTCGLEQLDTALDNLRAALEWSCTHHIRLGLRLAAALEWYWNLRGHWHEALHWYARLDAAPGAQAPTLERARFLAARGNLAYWGRGDHRAAAERLNESIAIQRTLDPP